MCDCPLLSVACCLLCSLLVWGFEELKVETLFMPVLGLKFITFLHFVGLIRLFLCFCVLSLLDVPLNPNITILNLHCNHISKIEGLTEFWQLRHLDLSSNRITQINGLGSLSSLRTLNLSCNFITKVEGEYFWMTSTLSQLPVVLQLFA